MDSPTPSMPNLTPNIQQPASQGSRTLLIVSILVVLLLAAGGVFWWMYGNTPTETPGREVSEMKDAQESQVPDSTAAIDAELQETEDFDLDASFKEIDADLQGL